MATKRADRRTGGLFPELERKPDERFAVKRTNRIWTPAQEAVAVAAVCACQSRLAFDVMVPNLMDAIDHAPVYPENANVNPRKHLENCIRALELRIITKMLGGYDKWKPSPIMGFPTKFRDQNAPLTWGERAKILKPWWRRADKVRLSMDELHCIFGRDSSKGYVQSYLHELDMYKTKVIDPEVTPCPIPVTLQWAPILRMMVINLDQGLKQLFVEKMDTKKWVELQSHICKLLGVVT